jgi:hypothetical protein
MRVVVELHRQVRDDLVRWLVGRETDHTNRSMLVRVYLDELLRVLEETAGQPLGCVRVGTGEPQFYRWQYTDEVRIAYQIRTQRQGFLREISLRIIVTEILLEPAE